MDASSPGIELRKAFVKGSFCLLIKPQGDIQLRRVPVADRLCNAGCRTYGETRNRNTTSGTRSYRISYTDRNFRLFWPPQEMVIPHKLRFRCIRARSKSTLFSKCSNFSINSDEPLPPSQVLIGCSKAYNGVSHNMYIVWFPYPEHFRKYKWIRAVEFCHAKRTSERFYIVQEYMAGYYGDLSHG